ncbi:hypothetical protein ASZ90_006721 [hydrocarbon metagenome]|uniref:Lipoprotein n=1 Tax=hydrocarbon metagenome TaxID=938273 RepID=A0A0W8FRC3_9ZZZZ
MKRMLYSFLFIAAVIIIVSCGGKELPSINPGLYEIEFKLDYGGQSLVAKQRVRYNPDGTFEATNFNNYAAAEEIKGKYKMENKQLVSYDTYARSITQNSEWKEKEPSKVEIRKIKQGSYQYYFKFPNNQMRVLYKQVGMKEGWKTYTRISD